MAGSTVKAIKKVMVSTGRRGLDGASAYQVWLSEGNHGTIEDFIAYIKGDKGDKGDPGTAADYDPGDITLYYENALI